MADEADEANELTDMATRIAVEAARAKPQEVRRSGWCNNCGDACVGAFCDQDCRDDWEKRRRMRGGSG